MERQWKNLLFWVVAVLSIALATVLYQPDAANTGSLLIWMNNSIYIMDIDSLNLERVGLAESGQLLSPSPGCYGQGGGLCRVVAGQTVYKVDYNRSGSEPAQVLPVGDGFRWIDSSTVSWSPGSRHIAYSLFDITNQITELRIYDTAMAETVININGVDPDIAVVWTAGCAAGIKAAGCKIGYKTDGALVEFTPALDEKKRKSLSERVVELRWSADNRLLYSRVKRYFLNSADDSPAHQLPKGGQLANISPDAKYTIYYQPFIKDNCRSEDKNQCSYMGVWLNDGADKPNLIYNIKLAEINSGRLNFVPVWSPNGDSFIFFQEGKLVHYDLQKKEATVWHKTTTGNKLRSVPVFSPNEEAVAFVDNQGYGFSEYRLVVVNPKLQPVEHIINTKTGFKVLAWLPRY